MNNKPKSALLSLLGGVAGIVLGGLLGLVAGGIIGIGLLYLIIETGPQSAKSNLDGATGMGGIIVLTALVGGVVGAYKGAIYAMRRGNRR